MGSREDFEKVIAEGAKGGEKEVEGALEKLRRMILAHGLPSETEEEKKGNGPTLRSRIWMILLRLEPVDADRYISLVEMGRSSLYLKTRLDSHRTFASSAKYAERVHEDKLIRALNAFVHATEGDPRMGYVQGMNTICGAFLYVLPEVEAYYCYERFIRFHVPRYVYPSLDGVHTGTKLLDDVLEKVDPELHKHLLFKGLTAKIYGFASLLSFSAATPPLDELVKLWDFYLAFGAHLNVVAVAAQVVLIRKELLASDSPMKLLRKFPNLRSRAIIAETVRLVKLLDDKLYERLLKHAYEEPAEESAIKSPPAPAPPSTAASASSSSATNASTTSTTTPSSSSNSGAPAVPAAPKAAAT